MAPFERAMVVSYRLSSVTIIRPQFAMEVGHFGAKFVEEGVDRYKLNFNAIWERQRAVCAKEIVSIYSAV